MEFTNNAIFAGAILFLISILATGVASRTGAPFVIGIPRSRYVGRPGGDRRNYV